MSGTKTGGLKTVETIKDKYGDDYYRKIGTLGGKAKTRKGFAIDNRSWWEKLIGKKSRAQLAGIRGGHLGRRGKANGR